jgi:hypothetical protein
MPFEGPEKRFWGIEKVGSTDPVGAPIFYRDVPLMPSESEKR